jgi:hypothetical protein
MSAVSRRPVVQDRTQYRDAIVQETLAGGGSALAGSDTGTNHQHNSIRKSPQKTGIGKRKSWRRVDDDAVESRL